MPKSDRPELPAPPASLPEALHQRWAEAAETASQLGTLYACDLPDLERYVKLSWQYDAITPKIINAISHGDPQTASSWAGAQDKIMKQMQLLAAKFGFNSALAKSKRLRRV